MVLRKRLLHLTSIVLLCFTGGCDSYSAFAKSELSPADINNLLSSKVVKVECVDYGRTNVLSQGTGFFIDNRGTFVTNAHVIKGAYRVRIKDHNGVMKYVDRLNCFENINSDYAICSIPNYNSVPVTFAEQVTSNETCYSLGFPNNSNVIKQTAGRVISPVINVSGKNYIENSAEITFGSSGGILANKYGEVIGITSGDLTNGNYIAIPYSSFKNDLGKNTINQEPLDYFHSVQKVSLSSYNASTYFSAALTNASYNGYRIVTCTLSAQLRPAYWDYAFPNNGFGIVTLRFLVSVDFVTAGYNNSTTTTRATSYEDLRFADSGISSYQSKQVMLSTLTTLKIYGVQNLQYQLVSASGGIDLVY